jgi:hypothetical protein
VITAILGFDRAGRDIGAAIQDLYPSIQVLILRAKQGIEQRGVQSEEIVWYWRFQVPVLGKDFARKA